MPHLICSSCGLTSYSAARHASHDRCPRCDAALKGGGPTDDRVRQWNLAAVPRAARPEGGRA